MLINKTYKVEIKPNKKQEELFFKACGIKRFVYNYILNKNIEFYKTNNKSIKMDSKLITDLKQEYKDWMYDVPKSVHYNAFLDLRDSFKRFFKSLKTNKKSGFPKFKSKKDKQSFRMDNDRFKIINHYIKFQVFGKVKLKENNYIPTKNVKYNNATISYKGNKWFISVSIIEDIPEVENISNEILGIDLGVKTLTTCSNGLTFENIKTTKKYKKKLKRANRIFSRRKNIENKYSKRKIKALQKLRKIHFRIGNIRKDYINKLTITLVKTKPKAIVVENLNNKGLMKNHKLAGAIGDASFYEIVRQLEYKTLWNNIDFYKIDRFFPSSKRCNKCGNIKEDLKLSDRIYICKECGFEIDRDLNASYNIRDEYIRLVESEFTLKEMGVQ